MSSSPELHEYDEWLERVRTTYESVEFTCRHRLRDPALAHTVSMYVLAGMLARPGIFRHYGLPYSGRIAHLAEERIAAAEHSPVADMPDWRQVRTWLQDVPDDARRMFVLTHVHGNDTARIALLLDAPIDRVEQQRDDATSMITAISAKIVRTGSAERRPDPERSRPGER